jgi:phosphohistidine phosphatase SixA
MRRSVQSSTAVALLTLLSILSGEALADAALWKTLKSSNHFVLIRHAFAPGGGDPDNINVEDCSTQRNLNDEGRDQARSIGKQFRENGIDAALVYSSQWCRCLDTAELLKLGSAQELPSLNSFFEYRERDEEQTRETRNWVVAAPLEKPTVLVTHFVNISSLTGIGTGSGELVFVRRNADGGISVIGTIETPY